ncbi:MAG: hypothetical protein ACREN2_06215 [Candidatus Dormibacteria bacterium]
MPGGDDDPEIAAMAAISNTLAPLDSATRARVLAWAGSRFEVSPPLARGTSEPGTSGPREGTPYSDVAELFEAASPVTNADKALVVSYWFQQTDGQRDIDAQRVNTQLKQLGHGIPNITSAYSELMGATPKLALQVRKTGSTKQARKRYRITGEGIKRVNELLQGTSQ